MDPRGVEPGKDGRTPVRVVLADDHTLFREGLVAILSSSGSGIEVVGQSSTGDEAVALVGRLKPDVAIMQLEMNLKEAEKILSRMCLASPRSRIVVLTMLESPRYVRALSGLGIDAYVHKSSSSEELIGTIGVLSRESNGRNVMVSMPRRLLKRLGDEPSGGLSEREIEIVVIVARGLTNDQIARELNLHPATVKRHLANIYSKIGVRSRSDLVRKALAEEWIGIHEIASTDPGDH